MESTGAVACSGHRIADGAQRLVPWVRMAIVPGGEVSHSAAWEMAWMLSRTKTKILSLMARKGVLSRGALPSSSGVEEGSVMLELEDEGSQQRHMYQNKQQQQARPMQRPQTQWTSWCRACRRCSSSRTASESREEGAGGAVDDSDA